MAFHHPFFADDRCQMHVAMAQACKKWYDELGRDQQETIRRLSKVNPYSNPRLYSLADCGETDLNIFIGKRA